jgi:hypothetical protein
MLLLNLVNYAFLLFYVFLLLCMFFSVYSVSMCCSVYFCVYMCTVLLPLGVNQTAVNKIYHIIYHVFTSVRLQETTCLPLNGLSWNLIGVFSENLLGKTKFHSNRTNYQVTLHEDQYTFVYISPILLRMRNVSDESCRKNQNTHFMFNNPFPPKFVAYAMWKNTVQPEATDNAHAHCIQEN